MRTQQKRPLASVALSLLALCGGQAYAQTFKANVFFDGHDNNPGDGECRVNNRGDCTLRAAVEELEALAAFGEVDGTVNLVKGTYKPTLGLIQVKKVNSLTLRGKSAYDTIIDGSINGNRQFLRADSHAENPTTWEGAEVNLRRLTIRKFNNTGFGYGGAVNINTGTNLDARRVHFEDNKNRLLGGAVGAFKAHVNLKDCVFKGNETTRGSGGGVTSSGGALAMIKDSWGQIERTSFYYNKSVRGGAIVTTGPVNIFNSTFAYNEAYGHGGAILNWGSDELPWAGAISFTTIVGNKASFGANGLAEGERRGGAGIYSYGPIRLGSNIIADNETGSYDSDDTNDCKTETGDGRLISWNGNIFGRVTDKCYITPESSLSQWRDQIGSNSAPIDPGLPYLRRSKGHAGVSDVYHFYMNGSSPARGYGATSDEVTHPYFACHDADDSDWIDLFDIFLTVDILGQNRHSTSSDGSQMDCDSGSVEYDSQFNL